MYYQRLFALDIEHEYYQNKFCPDLTIEPTIECQKILNGHRLILKNKSSGIEVIAAVDSRQNLLIELADNLKFTFILRVNDLRLIDFTAANFAPKGNTVLLFSNQNQIEQEENTYLLESSNIELSVNYGDRSEKIFGLVEINNNSSLAGAKTKYKISLKSKKQKWHYYLITNLKTREDEFAIVDKDNAREPRIEFVKTEIDPQNLISSRINQQFSNTKQYQFSSDREIACQEAGIKNIQLLKKRANGTPLVWIEHLPNPPNNNGVQIINTLKYL